MKNTILLLIALITLPYISYSDITGSSDHPVISRYSGSDIIEYDKREFDEYRLLTGKVNRKDDPDTDQIRLEGKVTRISYYLPEDRSTLEVIRNYEMEMNKNGFEILFSCSNKECGGREFNHTVHKYDMRFGDNYYDQRYLSAKLIKAEGDIYVSLYVVKNTAGGGKDKNHIYTQLDVIQVAPMQEEMVIVNADTMKKEIFETGSVSIYGIYFDFDKSDIKPESAPAINEIVKLLKANPNLNVFIVGHTDNKGTIEYNTNLSQKRAEAVVAELINKHGISASRLAPKGLAFYAPVASNRLEDGRAKNRRVELVEREF